jgi:hypothetical protein
MGRQQVWRVLAAATLIIAAAGQLRVWATGRGFWGDELAIAINLPSHTVSGLAGPLAYRQVAPWGWLVGEKALFELLGPDERVLRLPSLGAALLVLVLTAVIAYRAIGPWAVVAAVGLVGASPELLYYAGELKQYVVEAAVALGLLVMGDEFVRRCRDSAGPKWTFIAVWAIIAAGAVTLSYTGLIVLAGTVGGLAGHLALRRRWAAQFVLLLAAVPAGLVGGWLVLRRLSLPMARGQDLVFATGMPPAGSDTGQVLAWLPQMWVGFVTEPLRWQGAWWVLPLVTGGFVALIARGRHHWAAMFAGVLGAAVAVAAVRGLPLADRVALYLVAPVILLVVAAVDGLARGLARTQLGPLRRTPRMVRAAAGVLAAAVVLVLVAAPAVRAGVDEVADPTNRELGREAIEDVGGRLQPGDVVLVYWYSDRVVRWYGDRAGVQPVGRVDIVPEGEQCRPQTVDRALAGASRVWYLYGRRLSSDPADLHDRVIRELAERGHVVDTRTFHHDTVRAVAGWALIDLAAEPDLPPEDGRADSRPDCLVSSAASTAARLR